MDGTFHCCTEIALLKGGQNRHSGQWAAQNTVGPWIVRKNIKIFFQNGTTQVQSKSALSKSKIWKNLHGV